MSAANELPMIEAIHLSKFYGDFTATRDISFSIKRGEVVAFLGPNGAGKSTTMKLLTGFISPSTGSAKIAGFDMSRDRLQGAKHLGYLPENGPLYPDMTPRMLLEFFADARGLRGAYKPRASQCRDRSMRSTHGDWQGDQQALQGLPPTCRHGAGSFARAGCIDPRRTDCWFGSLTRFAKCAMQFAAWAKTRRFCFRLISCRKFIPLLIASS